MQFKLVVFGGSAVGKSALIIQFISGHFVTDYETNIEDSFRKRVSIDDDAMVVDILDTSSCKEFLPLREQYIRMGQGFLLICSLLKRESFLELKDIVDQIFSIKGSETPGLIICCNKSDYPKSEWEIDVNEVKQFAYKYEIPVLLTSAFTRHNVEESFYNCVREIKKHTNHPDKSQKGKRELYLTRKRQTNFGNELVKPVFQISESSYISDFAKIYENMQQYKIYSDIVLETEEGSCVFAHSVITSRCGKKEIEKFKDMEAINEFVKPLYCLSATIVKINEMDTLVSMNDHLKQWVNNLQYSDITFKLTDGEVHAHKVILAARCAYFHTMFSSNMKESKQSIFQVENYSLAHFLMFIEYIYTDSFPEAASFETLQTMLVLANQYNLTRLCEICEKQMAPFVTHSNAIEILSFAEMLGTVPNLSKYAMYVIHTEIAILLLTGALLNLPPELRKEAIKHKMTYNFQGIGNLPTFLISKVFSFLDLDSLKNVSFVCYDWRFLSNSCWETHCQQRGWKGREDMNVWKDYYFYRSSIERNWENGKYVKTVLSGHTGAVSCLSLEGDILASSSWDKTVRLWDLSGNQDVKVLNHTSDVQCVLLKESLVVSGGSDALLKLWDIEGTEKASLVGHESAIKCVDRDTSVIISSSDDTYVKVWDIESLQCTSTFKGHKKGVWSVVLSDSIVFSGDNQYLKSWDLRTGKENFSLKIPVTCLKKRGEKLLVASRELVLELDVCGTTVREWKGNHGDTIVTCVDVFENRMASGGFDSTVKTNDLKHGKVISVLEHPKAVRTLQMDESRLFTGCYDKNIYLFDYSNDSRNKVQKYKLPVKNKNCTVQ